MNLEESNAYGIKLGSITERLDRFEEGVEVIVRLLSQETTDFAGKYFTITDARCEPKPIQQPHPPLLIGGSGKKRTLAVVARWAQKWDGGFNETVAQWQAKNEALLGHCERLGRDQREIYRTAHIAWPAGADPSEARRQGLGIGRRRRRPGDLQHAWAVRRRRGRTTRRGAAPTVTPCSHPDPGALDDRVPAALAIAEVAHIDRGARLVERRDLGLW